MSRFHFSTDGSGYEAIIIRDGGYRHPFDNQSLDVYTTPEGLRRTRLNTEMDGMSVFSFGITKAPQSFNLLMERFSLDWESLDYFVMHQANYFFHNIIRRRKSHSLQHCDSLTPCLFLAIQVVPPYL